MKITFLLPGYTWIPSGGYRVVYEHANRLVARGHEVAVVHPRHLEFYQPPAVPFLRRLRLAQYSVMELFVRPSIDWQPVDDRVRLLFVPTSDQRYIPDADVLFATAWHTARPVIECSRAKGEKCYFIQHYEACMGPKHLVDETWRMPMRKVVVSRWLLEVGRELCGHTLSYVPNGIDHEHYRVMRPIERRRRQIVMMHSPVDFKGSRDGVAAMQMVKERFPDVPMVLFGTGRRSSWIPKWMTYVRNPPQRQIVEELYNNSSIVLSPSLTEGFALPPAEGAACGCAIVATDSGGIRDFAEQGVSALLSPPRDPEALANNLCRLLADDDLRIRLAHAANKRIKQFTWERSSDLLQEFITASAQPKSPECQLPSCKSESSLMTPVQAEGD